MTDLFNLVIAATQNPKRGFADPSFRHKNVKRKQIDIAAKKTRVSLLGAQKFYVCDSLIGHACEVVEAKPKIMLNMMSAAIPAFDNMWIEWNEPARQARWSQVTNDFSYIRQPPESVGMHIYADPNGNDGGYLVDLYFIANERSNGKGTEGKIGLSPYALRFTTGADFDWENLHETPNTAGLVSTAHSLGLGKAIDAAIANQSNQGPLLLGTTYTGGSHGKTPPRPHSPSLERLYKQVGMIPTEEVGKLCVLASVFDKYDPYLPVDERMDKAFQDATRDALTGWHGEIRWVISILALLNYSHTVIARDQEPSGARRIAYGQAVPRNELRVVEIDLPKPRGTIQYEKLFSGSGAKKRRHVRRGHWRRYVHKDGTVSTRWIPEQWVGDASLGTIIHEYELVNRRNKA